MADAPIRRTWSETTTTVRYSARPLGFNRTGENPPHLADLRAFVEACEGLPDDVLVRIQPDQLDEGGRRNVEFSVSYRHPDDTTQEQPDA